MGMYDKSPEMQHIWHYWTLKQVLKVSSGTCQQFVDVLSKSVTFFGFSSFTRYSVATYCRWGGNVCDVYTENFLTNHLVKEFWKSVRICKTVIKHQTAYFFSEHGVVNNALDLVILFPRFSHLCRPSSQLCPRLSHLCLWSSQSCLPPKSQSLYRELHKLEPPGRI